MWAIPRQGINRSDKLRSVHKSSKPYHYCYARFNRRRQRRTPDANIKPLEVFIFYRCGIGQRSLNDKIGDSNSFQLRDANTIDKLSSTTVRISGSAMFARNHGEMHPWIT